MKHTRKSLLFLLSIILGASIGCAVDLHVQRAGEQLDLKATITE